VFGLLFSWAASIIMLLIGISSFNIGTSFAGVIFLLSAFCFNPLFLYVMNKKREKEDKEKGEETEPFGYKNSIAGGTFFCVLAIIIGVWTNEEAEAVAETEPETQIVTNANKPKEWYEGGTLHKATLSEWQSASYENKLATSADMAIHAPRVKRAVEEANSVDAAKSFAHEVIECLDKFSNDNPAVLNQKVADTAAICIGFMGWLK